MPKQKSQTSPSKTIKSLFTKSQTILNRVKTKQEIFKSAYDTWIKEIQALSAQISLIDESIKNKQTILSADFSKMFSDILKKFNKIKDEVDKQQTELNKISEDVKDDLIAHMANAKKKAEELALEGNLNKNIQQINTDIAHYQKLIHELHIGIQALDKKISANENVIHHLSTQPHIIELSKKFEKLCISLELLCKETKSFAAVASPVEKNDIQLKFLPLLGFSKKIDDLLTQSKTHLIKTDNTATAASTPDDNKDQKKGPVISL